MASTGIPKEPKLYGSSEFIKGNVRWCLWLDTDNARNTVESIPDIKRRIGNVKKFREQSKDSGTKKLAEKPHQFREMREAVRELLLISRVSSERRAYIPMGILDKQCVVADAQVIYDPPTWIFSVVSSRMHMTWVRAVAGRLETRIRYSSSLCYNTFPFPDISAKQKEKLEEHVFAVLDEREKHPEKTMAQLYDPDKMPAGLRQAHHDMDIAIEQCYRAKPFSSDEERLEYLFTLYEAMIAAEKKRG
ncbi:type IIL restriction-modification enzyme MmeI [Thiothrix lacustris]|uniref:type IIL restriction-modification enzyme MmeI n=1 Tax=Thiothrix lacustris TaxID=525917 RepID=UPI0027E5806A|nr:type IIL restriction-modification enzyme MmeI [Thiothrix lacustris]WMP17540.1 hypothetical protein RCS87_00380 [Thiothrix lacustris]